MAEPSAPEVLRRLVDGISDGRWLELHELYAEDAVIEYPFALPAPTRLEGRPAIREYFAGVAGRALQLRARDVVMHQSVDPDVVVVEYGYDGTVTTTGRTFEVSNIQVSTVRGGLIVRSRDYHNHAMLAHVSGRLDDVVATLTGGHP